MRTLTYSLLLFVFIATAGLGWLFDFAYDNDDEPHRDIDKVRLVEEMGAKLALTLDTMPDKDLFIKQWQTSSSIGGNSVNNRVDNSASLNNQVFQLNVVKVKELPMPSALLSQVKRGIPLLLETSEHLSWHFYLPRFDEILLLKAPVQFFFQREQSREYFFTIAFYISLLALLLLWAYPLIKQLHALRKTAKLFGRGQLEQRVAPSSISYIQDIEDEFNRMANRIEGLVGDVKLLSSAVSHDLRTPLARIRFGIDTLEEEDDPVIRAKYQNKISKHVDDMTALVETLLNYARLDQAMVSLEREPVNIEKLVKAIVDKYNEEQTFIQRQTTLANYVIQADKSYLNILLNNLIQNAIKYGNGKVLVSLDSDEQHVFVHIHDNGPGVPIDQRQEIIKPFIRGEQSSNSSKGHGVGLAIVKRVLDWHQGQLDIKDSDELSGADFLVMLPKNNLG